MKSPRLSLIDLLGPVACLAVYVYMVVSVGLPPASALGIWFLGTTIAVSVRDLVELHPIIDHHVYYLLTLFWPLTLLVVVAVLSIRRLAGRRG